MIKIVLKKYKKHCIFLTKKTAKNGKKSLLTNYFTNVFKKIKKNWNL